MHRYGQSIRKPFMPVAVRAHNLCHNAYEELAAFQGHELTLRK